MKTVSLWALAAFFPVFASAQFSVGLTGTLNLPHADFREFVGVGASVELNGRYSLSRRFFLDAALSYTNFDSKEIGYVFYLEYSTVEIAFGPRRWEYYGIAVGGGYRFLPNTTLNPYAGLDVGYMIGYREVEQVEVRFGVNRIWKASGPVSYAVIVPKFGFSVPLSSRLRLEPAVRYNFNFKSHLPDSHTIWGSDHPRHDLFLQLAIGLYATLR